MKIFVIILSYNSVRYTRDCLDSVLRSTIPVDVVVVENGSRDDSATVLQEYKDRIHYLPQKSNLGFSGGNNVGISYAIDHDADYLFLLNMDTRVEEDTIEKLVKVAEVGNEKLLLSPLPRTFAGVFDLGFVKKCCNNLTEFEFRNFITDLYDRKPLKPYYTADFICASALLVPVSAVKECGGFCTLFYPAYYEDNELFNRMTLFSWKLAFVPSVIYYHDVEDRATCSFPDSHLITMRTFSEVLDLRNPFFKTYCVRLVSELGKIPANLLLCRCRNVACHFHVVVRLLKAYFPLKKYRKSIVQKWKNRTEK